MMKTWLIYPPFADPTQPYGSLPLLKGYLQSHGQDATVVDLNLTAARHLLGRKPMRTMAEAVAEQFTDLNTDRPHSFSEQMHYLALAEAIPAARRVWTAPDLPVAIFCDPQRFFDLNQYNAARNLAEDALQVTSAAGYPTPSISTKPATRPFPGAATCWKRIMRNSAAPWMTFTALLCRNAGSSRVMPLGFH